MKLNIYTDSEVKWLEAIKLLTTQEEGEFLSSIAPKSKRVVFCHNDLLANNLYLKGNKKEMKFLDFEYGSMNY